ncbi:hypothetical protein BDR26DRAFT_849183 [Obelidium mucronatum]|nr:hypothetical protein BDR26DRAFT_849183 [Obelidium mucronatum]
MSLPITFAHLPSETIDAILIHLPINSGLIRIALASKYLLAPFLLASQPFANRHCNHQALFIDKNPHLTMQYWIYRCLLEYPAKTRYWSTIASLRADEMMTACKRGLNSIVRILLVEGVAISDSHLNIAAKVGNAELVTLFLQQSSINKFGYNTLELGIRSTDPNTVSILVSHPKLDWNSWSDWCLDHSIQDTRYSPFDISPKRTEIVRLLLSHPNIDPSAGENLALKSATKKRNFEVINMLLKDPRVDPCIHRGRLFQLACKYGNVELLGRLLSDSRFRLSDFDPLVPLRTAFKRGNPQILELLVRYMNLNHILTVATEYQNLQVLEQLFSSGRLGLDFEDSNALRVACLDGNPDVRWQRTENESLEWAAVEMLVDAGVSCSANDFGAMCVASIMHPSGELKDRVWAGL